MKNTNDLTKVTSDDATAALKKDFLKLQGDAKDILARIKEAGGEISQSFGENALKILKDTTREGNEKVHEYIDTFESAIKKKPILSTAIAFGVGMLIARMTSWTSHR